MPVNFCPECGAKAVAGAKFCPECGSGYGASGPRQAAPSQPPPAPAPSSTGGTEDADSAVTTRSDVSTDAALKDTVVGRSTVRGGGAIEGSVVSRSDVRTQEAGIRDAVISHSTITQTETHQHFGESVGTYEAQMDLGRTAYEGKNWQEAVDFFNTALKMEQRNFEPWHLKGMSCAELRRTDEAATNLRRALKLSGPRCGAILDDIRAPSDRHARQGMVQETSANELIARARMELQHSANYQSQSRAGKEKGFVQSLALDLFVIPGLGSSMRTNQAVEGLEKRQEADKREAEGRRLEEQAKGFASEAVRLYNAAIRFCDLVIEFEKQDAPCWLRRGELYFRLRLYDDACKSYEAVLEFNPGHIDALRMRGMCFNAQGRPVPPPPGPTPPRAAPPSGIPPGDTPKSPSPIGEPSAEGLRTPMIPQPLPSVAQAAAPVQPRPVAMPPVPPGRALQMAPAQTAVGPPGQSPEARPAPQGGPAPVQNAYPDQPPRQARPVQQARSVHPGQPPASRLQPGPCQAPMAARPAAPPQYPAPGPGAPRHGMPNAAPRTAGANPCPYCRGEMFFLREKGIWQCGSCRQFSARPAR